MKATLFDFFGPEVVPVHWAEIENCRQRFVDAYYRLGAENKGSQVLHADLVPYRTAYESAVRDAKKAFKGGKQ